MLDLVRYRSDCMAVAWNQQENAYFSTERGRGIMNWVQFLFCAYGDHAIS
jgi:hypothetical protein